MQNVSFKTPGDFYDYLPENERGIVEVLRSIVVETIPDYREKLAYNVPYFWRHQRICFIWPSCITWGNVQPEGVLFGFCYGHLLTDIEGYLDTGDRKHVYTKTFFNTREIDPVKLRSFVFESVLIDEDLFKQKRENKLLKPK